MSFGHAVTPPRRQAETSTPQSRVRFSRVIAQFPLGTSTPSRQARAAEAGSPSKSREASPLTLPYAEFAPASNHESDIAEESMEMGEWGSGKGSRDRKELYEEGELDNTPRKRILRHCMFHFTIPFLY